MTLLLLLLLLLLVVVVVVVVVVLVVVVLLILVVVQSKSCVCGSSLGGILGSNPRRGMDVRLFVVVCVLSGRGLCVGLITHPEDSNRVWCV